MKKVLLLSTVFFMCSGTVWQGFDSVFSADPTVQKAYDSIKNGKFEEFKDCIENGGIDINTAGGPFSSNFLHVILAMTYPRDNEKAEITPEVSSRFISYVLDRDIDINYKNFKPHGRSIPPTENTPLEQEHAYCKQIQGNSCELYILKKILALRAQEHEAESESYNFEVDDKC